MQITRFKKLLTRVERELSPEQQIELRQHLETIESERATELALGVRAQAV